MVGSFEKKYYPFAGKKSPYVILEPDECTSMMAEEYVQYSDPNLGKMKNFSRLAKYVITIWLLLATFIVLQQIFFRDALLFGRTSNSFYHSINYVFSGSGPENSIEGTPELNERVYKGLEKCIPGKLYKPDKCNTCHCDTDGGLACTKMFCPKDESPDVLI